MRRRPYRAIVAGACAAAAAGTALAAGGPTPADGPLLELLIAKRALVASAAPGPAPVAVIAVDRRSLDSPEFADVPRALMGRKLAPVIDALVRAGARAVGFDIIFAYRGDRLRPGHDDPFLDALGRHRRRLVLARSEEMTPDNAFAVALGAMGVTVDPDAVALATIVADADGVFRRVRAVPEIAPLPGQSAAELTPIPSLAAALLRRGGGPAMPPEVLLAPRRHLEAIPTYALVDVVRCASAAPAALAGALAGRIVLVGGTLPEEDRKVPAGRLLEAPRLPGPMLHPCGLRRLAASAAGSGNVPGVYLHAAAVEAVTTGGLTRTVAPILTAAVAAVAAATGATLGLVASPWVAVAGVALLAALLFAGATGALMADTWVPIAVPLGALVAAPAIAYVVRYLLEERTRRRIQLAFSHYLSPQVVDRLASEPAALRLGGERRDVTVMFADLSGFTALSGKLPPEALTSLTNQYLGYIVEQVEATGGYVDKFIGDAVMAIWGAPAPDPAHAVHAVRAAIAEAARIRAEGEAAAARGERSFAVKIGLNSGPAVVGNVGTERRYNYTAVGETVNVAARLEGVPGLYGCALVLGPTTADAAAAEYLLGELDVIQVKGREAPLTVWEPIAPLAGSSAEQRDRVRRYAEGLALYRARRFADAAALWETLAKDEAAAGGRGGAEPVVNPAARMAERARDFVAEPPPASWAGVWVLTGK
jgi:class 3 adenylate cyclase/CHASE2 domain-containing sensor protein